MGVGEAAERDLELGVGLYEPIGTPHPVVALSTDDLSRLGLLDHDWLEVRSGAQSCLTRVRNREALKLPPGGTVYLTHHVRRSLQLPVDCSDSRVAVSPRVFDRTSATTETAHFTEVDRWDSARCSRDVAPSGSRWAEVTNPQTGDSLTILLVADAGQSHSRVFLSGLQRRLLGFTKNGVEVHIREADPRGLGRTPVGMRARGYATALGIRLVGATRLPGRVHPANPVDQAAQIVRVSEPLWTALGLQDGDRIICRAHGRSVGRRASPRPLPAEPAEATPAGSPTPPGPRENPTQGDFAIFMDQLAREALGLTRREGDAVEVFRDPFGALSRSLSTSTVSGLLTAITVAQAGSLLGDATGWAAVLAGGAVFYFALSAERSRVR